MNLRGLASTLILTAIAIALTLTTVVLAPLPLMLMRRNNGRISFFIGSALAAVTLAWIAPPVVAVFFLASVILSIVFCESESQNIGYTSSVFVSLLVVSGFCAIATGYAIQHYGFDPIEFLRGQITLGLSQLSLPSGVTLDKEALIRQVPSVLLILIIFSTWVNSVLVTRIEHILSWKPAYSHHVFVSSELLQWKLPDTFVWLALATAGGTYFDFEPSWLHWVATNLFNVVVLLYFFQGLAVIVNFFAVKKVSPMWRAIAYVFIFSQLFLMVAFVGFADLWVGFRNRTKSGTSAVA